VHGYDHLPPVPMAPFLVAPALVDQGETMSAQHAHHILGAANWEVPAQGKDTSSSLAVFFNFSFEGSNHNASASFAFSTASASVSPAEAQPGSSGKTADQRLAFGSNSTTNRSFMRQSMPCFLPAGKNANFLLSRAGIGSAGGATSSLTLQQHGSWHPVGRKGVPDDSDLLSQPPQAML
jgi:hypothetical protein